MCALKGKIIMTRAITSSAISGGIPLSAVSLYSRGKSGTAALREGAMRRMAQRCIEGTLPKVHPNGMLLAKKVAPLPTRALIGSIAEGIYFLGDVEGIPSSIESILWSQNHKESPARADLSVLGLMRVLSLITGWISYNRGARLYETAGRIKDSVGKCLGGAGMVRGFLEMGSGALSVVSTALKLPLSIAQQHTAALQAASTQGAVIGLAGSAVSSIVYVLMMLGSIVSLCSRCVLHFKMKGKTQEACLEILREQLKVPFSAKEKAFAKLKKKFDIGKLETTNIREERHRLSYAERKEITKMVLAAYPKEKREKLRPLYYALCNEVIALHEQKEASFVRAVGSETLESLRACNNAPEVVALAKTELCRTAALDAFIVILCTLGMATAILTLALPPALAVIAGVFGLGVTIGMFGLDGFCLCSTFKAKALLNYKDWAGWGFTALVTLTTAVLALFVSSGWGLLLIGAIFLLGMLVVMVSTYMWKRNEKYHKIH